MKLILIGLLILAGCSSDGSNNGNNGADATNTNNANDTGADVGADTNANNAVDMRDSTEDVGPDSTADLGEDASADVGPDATVMDGCPEPVPNDDKATATPLALETPAMAVLCGSEYDVFAVDLTAGTTVTGTLSDFSFDTENLDLSLLNDVQADDIDVNDSVAFTFAFGEASESFDYDVTTTGTYYLVVFNNNEGDSDYTVQMSVQ